MNDPGGEGTGAGETQRGGESGICICTVQVSQGFATPRVRGFGREVRGGWSRDQGGWSDAEMDWVDVRTPLRVRTDGPMSGE